MNIYNNGRATLTVGDIERMQQRIAELEQKNAELVAQVKGLNKANSKLSQIENKQGRINQLEAALDCLQFAAHLNAGQCKNLDKALADSLVIHNNAPDEMPSGCLRQIHAEAGRAGFVAGFSACWRELYGTKPFQLTLELFADQYAERVKAGE